MSDAPPHADAALMTGLGTVIARWAYVDQLMGEFLSFLAQGNPALMYVITNNVSGSTIADWIRTLLVARYSGEEPPKEITDLLTSIDDIRRERNALVHGLWSPHAPDVAEVQTIRWERREIVKIELVTKADLEHLVHDIDDAIDALAALGKRYGFPVMPKDA
jgi:hypothetical protein